jgi:hypothetical protein
MERFRKLAPAYAKLAYNEAQEGRKESKHLEAAFAWIEQVTRTAGYPPMAQKVQIMRNLEDWTVSVVESFFMLAWLLEREEAVPTTARRFMLRIQELDRDAWDFQISYSEIPQIVNGMRRRLKK